jgi:hypothetical protein
MNFSKTKAEITKYVKKTDRPAVTPEVIDTVTGVYARQALLQ